MNNIEKFEDFLDKMQGLLDNAKKQGHIIIRVEDLENAFPELKESEDERVRKEIVRFIQMEVEDEIVGNKWLAWLEKQKVLTLDEEKQGKEDVLWCINQAKKHAKNENEMGTCWFAEKWLEKQGAQILANSAKTCKNEPKPTWSEEDEKNIACYNLYKEVVESIAEMCKHYDKASHSGLRDFYDNVKVKCKDAKEYDSLFPQSTWKPSDEQMEALDDFIYAKYPNIEKYGAAVKSLYQDLKKIK